MADTLQTKRFYVFGPYRLDHQARVLFRDGTIVPLTPKVLDTLAVLVEHPGAVLSKDQLLKAVWPNSFVEESNLSQNVSVLRKALGHDPENFIYIETVSKRGYRFVAEVTVSERQIPAIPVDALTEVLPASIDEQAGTARRKAAWAPGRFGVAIWVTLVVFGALSMWYEHRLRSGISGIRALAVLPLKNLSGDPAQEYFADGITELLTAELSKTLPVRVTSRTSAMRYRNSEKSLRTIAYELKVDAVIEGSVVRSGDRVRITAQLISASSDRHVWAETYDRELTDVTALQREIARAVAHEIRARTTPDAADGHAPLNRAAFEDYLRARYYLDQRSAESIPKAILLYHKAIGEDPAYARAYAGLADCYNQMGTVMIGGGPPSESRRMAIAAASRALEIDPKLAEAHAALGYSNLYEWNWDVARKGLDRAISLNPNYAPGHLWLAHYLAARAKFDEALQEVRLARDLDPLSPIIQTQVGWMLGHAGRFVEAIPEFRKALEMEPNYPWATWQLGGALMETGDYTGAIQVLQGAIERNRTPSALALLGKTYALAGQKAEAQKILSELLALSRERYVPPHCLVDIYCGLRDRNHVFEWLEKSYQERSNAMVWLRVWASVNWLRSDPRFKDLLRRIGHE